MRIHIWPGRLGPAFEGLEQRVAADLLADVAPIADVAEIAEDSPRLLLAVPEAAVMAGQDAGTTLSHLLTLATMTGLTTALVVGDGYLGTDLPDLEPTVVAAAALATARSMAVRRDGGCRANVVAVPDVLFDRLGSQRAPLRHQVGVHDVADAVSFFLSADGAYCNGQVLFVDGGRHLFSSMTA